MKRVGFLALFAAIALAGVMSSSTPGHAQEAAGGCTPGTPDSGGYSVTYGMPPAIPDNAPGGISLCMNVTSIQVIRNLRVMVAIQHSWVGDLIVTLRHEETGTTVTLLDRPGIPASLNGCSGDDLIVLFDDGAPTAAEDECATTAPALFAVLRPNAPLAAFDGEAMSGRWWLSVSDVALSDTGVVQQWGIVSYLKGDASCNGVTDPIDAALVLQFDAGLLGIVPCPFNADYDNNKMMNAIDAALILQDAAGLI